MGIRRGTNPITTDHIDPRRGKLVSGLDVSENLTPISHSRNSFKTNRFVPYRVCALAAPRNFGDVCEFLIEGEWVACEFGGEEWRIESNRIGHGGTCAPGASFETQSKGGRTSGRNHVESGHWKKCSQARARNNSRRVLLTRLDDGNVFFFSTVREACKRFKLNEGSFRALLKGEKPSLHGFTAITFPDQKV